MFRDPPSVKPLARNYGSYASAVMIARRRLFVGHNPMGPVPPSLHRMVSPSPCPTPQTSSQKANNIGDPIFRSPEIDEGQNTRLHASPGTMLQDPPSDKDCDHSETHTDFRSILSGKNSPRREKGNKWLSELSVREFVSPLLRSP